MQSSSGPTRRLVLGGLAALPLLRASGALAQTPGDSLPGDPSPDPLPSWNDGPAKAAIIDLVKSTTDPANSNFVAPEARVATFDQDGTTWVEHPVYTQVIYCLERVPAVVEAKPELKDVEPFKTVLSGDREAIARLPLKDLEEIAAATLTGMTVDEFRAEASKWIATAKHPRWDRLYTELTYAPMLDVMRYLRANGYKTYIVTGGGQDFVRAYAERVYGIPPEQVIGSAAGVTYGYDKDGRPILTKEPKLLLNDNNAGKPESIHLEIGRRPVQSPSAIRPATGKCSNMPRPARARARRCSCCTTTRRANTPTGRRRGCRTRRSGRSRRNFMTKQRQRAGSSSA